MRKIISLLVVLTGVVNATADKLKVSELYDDEYGTYFYVSVEGTQYYTGYQVEFSLPDGLKCDNIVMAVGTESYDGSDIYPYTTGRGGAKTYSHTISSSNLDEPTIKVACISSKAEVFKEKNGYLFTIYVTKDLSKNGAYSSPDVKIINAKLILPGEGNDIPEPFSQTIITDTWPASCALNVSQANQYSTCILPFSATIPTGLKAFSARGTEDGAVVLEEASEFAAYIPYILYAAQGYSGTVSGTVDPANYVDSATDGLLVGAIQPLDATSGYVMQNQGQGVKFYQIKQGDHYTINSGKCYLNIPESHSPMFDLDASLTSVTSAQTAETESCEYRDLQGRPIAEPVVGQMYIKGGKTYLKVK